SAPLSLATDALAGPLARIARSGFSLPPLLLRSSWKAYERIDGRQDVSFFAAPEPRERDRLAGVVRRCVREGAARREARAARHLRRLVSLVPRHGRDIVLRPGNHLADQRSVRGAARGQ